jgi:hypothetical protein
MRRGFRILDRRGIEVIVRFFDLRFRLPVGFWGSSGDRLARLGAGVDAGLRVWTLNRLEKYLPSAKPVFTVTMAA